MWADESSKLVWLTNLSRRSDVNFYRHLRLSVGKAAFFQIATNEQMGQAHLLLATGTWGGVHQAHIFRSEILKTNISFITVVLLLVFFSEFYVKLISYEVHINSIKVYMNINCHTRMYKIRERTVIFKNLGEFYPLVKWAISHSFSGR